MCCILSALAVASCTTVNRADGPPPSSAIAFVFPPVPGDNNVETALRSVEELNNSAESYVKLASAYIGAARRSGDFRLNVSARKAVEKALEIEPDHSFALRLKAALNLVFHEFSDALKLAETLAGSSPDDSFVLGVMTDAHTQLGNYPKALEFGQKMVDAKPNSQSYSRVALLRGLHGDTDGAVDMFKLAARTADPADKESQAWTLTQLGDLYWKNGKYDDAARTYSEALSILPEYPNAMFGKGRALASKGDLNSARSLISGAVERSPHTYSIIYLGDVMTKMGNSEAGEKLYKLADNTEALPETHDAHRIALYWADRDANLDQALAIAEADYAELKDIYAADILAWCLYKKGRFVEAREKSKEALRINTKDAILLYHAGMIEHALGNRTEAKRLLATAIKLNPAFDLVQAEIAARTLKDLN